VTIVAWILTGIFAALLARLVMPIPSDEVGLASAIVGVSTACIGGALAAAFFGGGLIYFNALSVGWATNAALCALFAFRCFSMRGT